jgi:chromosomal replication initiation ATPase DnaA
MTPPPRQLALPLAGEPSTARDDFVVTSANRVALDRIEAWPTWNAPALVLVGPEGSGKSHLASILAARAAALGRADLAIVEDADRGGPGDEALFHLWNRVVGAGGSLLLTARVAPALWASALPDLVSRLRSAPMVRLDPPDDALLLAVIAKHFSDRQLAVEPDVIGFIAGRIERSLGAVARVVERIDAEALATGRAVTRPFVARLLAGEPGDEG